MITIKDIQEYTEDTMVETIFRQREDELYNTKEKDNEEIKKITKNYPVDYERLIVMIKNLPPHFNNTRENILKAFDNYCMRENLIMALNNEKFYKARFL